jgi:hypothetical protein
MGRAGVSATSALAVARAAGVRLRLDGDTFKMSAATKPDQSVIDELRRHKSEIVALLRSAPYSAALERLRSACPALIDPDRWQQAIVDADSFLSQWGAQALALGWTAKELFGLHLVPEKPKANYSRLSRYENTGLIWLLRGRPVVALTETAAAIQTDTGNLIYRKLNKPALGPPGDSLDDFTK